VPRTPKTIDGWSFTIETGVPCLPDLVIVEHKGCGHPDTVVDQRRAMNRSALPSDCAPWDSQIGDGENRRPCSDAIEVFPVLREELVGTGVLMS
jgi:hypothetical protein